MSETRTPVEELSLVTLDSKPVHIDWSTPDGDDADEPRVEWWEAEKVEHDGNTYTVVLDQTGDVHAVWTLSGVRIDRDSYDDYEYDNSDDDGELNAGAMTQETFDALIDAETYATGPAMNYWYPIDDDLSGVDAAYALRGMPLVPVMVDGKYGLALSGGGQDLTWEIIEAFTALGYVPPVHFASHVPGIAGRGWNSELDRYLLDAADRSLAAMAERMTWAREMLAKQFRP